jgi:hypothetical protein
MRLRVSTGEEWPGGSAVFQTTFLLGPNSSGRPVVAETPVPFGPRNCDQSSATAVVNGRDAINSATDKAKMVFVTLDIVLREGTVLFSMTPILTRASKAGAILIERRRK